MGDLEGEKMLHIVQVVLPGGAEAPKVFVEEAAAHAAFVACAKTYWEQSYAVYCERNGVDADCFSSAQAFVAAFDLADRSRIHYWSVTPEDAGAGSVDAVLPGAAALQERREQILRLADEVEQASGIIREGLTELLDTLAGLTGTATAGDIPRVQPASGQDASGRLAATELPASELPATQQEAPQPSAEQYDTKEWKDYVESIKNMCGGSRSEFHLFNRYDWRQAVYNNKTSFEYWQWVAVTIDEYIERAQQAGYAVVPDPDKPGHYRFRTPDGVVSDISNDTEGEAWCRAGLHLEGR
jgi:hypothetical protein